MEFPQVNPTEVVNGMSYDQYCDFQNTVDTVMSKLLVRANVVWSIMRVILWPNTRDQIHKYNVCSVDTDVVALEYWYGGENNIFEFPTRLLYLSDEALIEYCKELYDMQLREKAEKAERDRLRVEQGKKAMKQSQLDQLLAEKERGEF